MTPTNDPTFSSLLWGVGKNNMGGWMDFAVFFPLNLLTSMPELPSSPTSNTDYVTATGYFTMKTDETPVFIYATEETVKYSAEKVGERDGISFEQKFEFFFPGNEIDVAGFASRIKNTPGILVLQDTDGRQIMVGSKYLPCNLAPSLDGGVNRADRRGTKFEGGCASNQMAVYLADASKLTIDPFTGTVTLPTPPSNT